MRSVLIICMGNELVCDDGIGIRVGRVLSALELPPQVRIELRPRVGMELIESLRRDDQLVVVDAACTGRPPGSCFSVTLASLDSTAATTTSAHAMGLAEVLHIARRVAPERLPGQVAIYCIEAGTMDRFGTELTAPVRAALPEAVEGVLRLVGAQDSWIQKGVELAKRRLSWDPEPIEALGG